MPNSQQQRGGGGGCSIPIGRWCLGIPIQLHWTFFLLLVLELINAIFNVNVFGYTVLVIVLYGPVLLFTVVMHELGTFVFVFLVCCCFLGELSRR